MAIIESKDKTGLGALNGLLIVLLLCVMFGELIYLATRIQLIGTMVELCVIAVALASSPRFGLREVYLMTFCTALSAAAWWLTPDPAAVIWSGLDQAAFLMAFIMLVGLIQQAGVTSEDVSACGLYLTRQPAGRRYSAIYLGTHLMAQLFNLGVISLLTPLIQRGGESNADDPLQPVREKRQLNAMVRGFAWAVIWSPTAVAPVVLVTLLPDVQRGPWIMVGLAIAAVIFAIGWGEDRWAHRRLRAQLVAVAPRVAPAFPGPAVGRFGIVCAALLVLTVGAMMLFDRTVVFGLMVASPIILVGWLYFQNDRQSAPTLARIGAIGRSYLPHAAPLAVTLASSGYIGRVAAELIPTEAWAAQIGLETMPGWLFLVSLSVGVAVLSQFALSPIMMAVFFGSLIADLPVLPADVTWAALAISCGWALSMTISPFATIILMIQGMTNHTGREITWTWNWQFTLLCILALAVAYAILTGGT
ncbi:hypothetical protein KHP62_03320 [Rhodobacteraceae bacterium NNCM2]|nr:hypothetical protein [Coraliihabitans acroporae]